MATATEPTTTELQLEVTALKTDLGKLLDTVKDLTVHQTHTVYDQARGRVLAANDSLERYIEARPISSVFFALGAGFALGSVLGNRH